MKKNSLIQKNVGYRYYDVAMTPRPSLGFFGSLARRFPQSTAGFARLMGGGRTDAWILVTRLSVPGMSEGRIGVSHVPRESTPALAAFSDPGCPWHHGLGARWSSPPSEQRRRQQWCFRGSITRLRQRLPTLHASISADYSILYSGWLPTSTR